MSFPCQIRVYERQKLVFAVDLSGAAELGRQNDRMETPFAAKPEGDHLRVVIAKLDESKEVSRKHVRVDLLPEGRVRLTNLSKTLPLKLDRGAELRPDSTVEAALPVLVVFGTRVIRIQKVEEDEEDIPLQGLAEATMAPALGGAGVASRFASMTPLPLNAGMEVESLVRWMRVTMEVLQSATGSLEFFSQAARAVVDLVGLDTGRVLLREDGVWKLNVVQTRVNRDSEPIRPPSQQVLNKVLQEKRTFWQVPSASGAASLQGIDAVVAAPILNHNGEVIGALYGDRSQKDAGQARPINKLEAMLVELLSSGVAAGLARLEQEQAAIRAQVQFEQFFTPELARELAARPELLSGQDMDITVLFCDIRGFSRITERLGAANTVEWINDVMGALSKCVLDQGGVLADYIGDELMAMFGAPVSTPDHAERACRAALAMLDELPKLQERWLSVVQERMSLGIGINSGTARVGNVGSTYKFKYGALGNTVNLASRVQGTTKYLKALILITEATRDYLGEHFATRRLCPVQVVNIEQPVALYELVPSERPGWQELKHGYEKALEHFEKKEFIQVMHTLGKVLLQHPKDGPSLVLMFLAVSYLREEPIPFRAVWELPGK